MINISFWIAKIKLQCVLDEEMQQIIFRIYYIYLLSIYKIKSSHHANFTMIETFMI